jgi:hypothetical protein
LRELPLTELTASWPARALVEPYVGNLPKVGRRVYKFEKEPGMRIDPPISVPTPINDPCRARRAASPPEEPPGDKRRLYGFV